MKKYAFIFILSFSFKLFAQYTKGDSLRGSLNPNRTWWDVTYYNLKVNVDLAAQTIAGSNCIYFKKLTDGRVMQVDLQNPLQLDSVLFHGKRCNWTHEFNAWMIKLTVESNVNDSLLVYYSGKPRAAKLPPWDGGISWKKDEKGRPWVGVSCQGLGASVWWPNKDHQSDEPDNGMSIAITIPDSLKNISNGRLQGVNKHKNGTATWIYKVNNPINNYDVTMNIGNYVTVKDSFAGLKGKLDVEYVVLDYNKEKIASHMQKDTKDMLKCFEYWFGPYPFYEDGYKLVETSYLGMEHQSAIAYGNKFKKGYLGSDRSRTGAGMLWDFIIIHESGHEWFGNNITCKDNADMWIHEAFTTYSEELFTECTHGKDTGEIYVRGQRRNILNDIPLIGDYGVNREGSSDIYDKGANMIHTIRQVINNDSIFRNVTLGLNKEFWKATVGTSEVETFISATSGIDFSKVFNQYLRTTNIPRLEYKFKKGQLQFKWANCNKDFDMPVKVLLNNNMEMWLKPTVSLKEIKVPKGVNGLTVVPDFYVTIKNGFEKQQEKK